MFSPCDDDAFIATASRLLLGMASMWLGDADLAWELLAEVARRAEDDSNHLARLCAEGYQALLAVNRGDLALAESIVSVTESAVGQTLSESHYLAMFPAAQDAEQVRLIADLTDQGDLDVTGLYIQPVEGGPEAFRHASLDGNPVSGRFHVAFFGISRLVRLRCPAGRRRSLARGAVEVLCRRACPGGRSAPGGELADYLGSNCEPGSLGARATVGAFAV